MLTLATAHFVKVLLNSRSGAQGEFYPVGMWFVAAIMDFVLFVGVLVLLGG